jgi:ATP-dependent helicase HrpA
VALIVPADFLATLPLARLPVLCRYLKALRIRAERAHVAPAKDAARAQQVAPHEEHFQRAVRHRPLSPELRRHLEEYREMIEEFKVSLFAQELGTAFPVSAKRLEKKWQEMELLC